MALTTTSKEDLRMKKIHLYLAGIVIALVPAVIGLAGNASFSQSVPLRAPQQTTTPSPTMPSPKPSATKATRHAEPGDDKGRETVDHDGPSHHSGSDDKGSGGHGSDD